MVTAPGEVDDKPNREPNDQPNPRCLIQNCHKREANDDAENRNDNYIMQCSIVKSGRPTGRKQQQGDRHDFQQAKAKRGSKRRSLLR